MRNACTSEYAESVDGVRKRSSGQPTVMPKARGVPRRLEPNKSWIVVSPEKADTSRPRLGFDVDEERDGIRGRSGPPDIFQLRRSSDGSDSADVPTDARRSAVLRSCSLITLDEE